MNTPWLSLFDPESNSIKLVETRQTQLGQQQCQQRSINQIWGRESTLPPDISLILGVPQKRIRWYINEIWDNRFGRKTFNQRYSWTVGDRKAVNFHVLIEFYVVSQLRSLGVSTRSIFKARNAIAQELSVAYPFATSDLLTDGKHIWYKFQDLMVNADGTKQLNFNQIIERYCQKIDFGMNRLAERFWPKGKENSIVVDPHHQFGQPIISGTNITARVLHSMHQAGEPVRVLSGWYEISEKQVKDAIEFCRKAA